MFSLYQQRDLNSKEITKPIRNYPLLLGGKRERGGMQFYLQSIVPYLPIKICDELDNMVLFFRRVVK